MSAVIAHVVGSLLARYASQITFMSLVSSSGLSQVRKSSWSALLAYGDCKSDGVVWCVGRPHTASLLTLPIDLNRLSKVLNW